MSYATQLTIEALTVGGVTVAGFTVVDRMIPESSLITKLFLTGVGIHLGFEVLGFNRWYLENGAETLK